MAKTTKERELDASWEDILKRHSKPLERGAKAKGIKVVTKPNRNLQRSSDNQSQLLKAKYVIGSGTKPAVDPLAEVKRQMAHRVGQAYNKGGLVYLSDKDMDEQKTGSHRRR